jgi:hypothetical protein
MVRRRAKASEWVKRIEAWRASGESAEVFCQKQGWKPVTLMNWARRLRQSSAVEATAPGFVRLTRRRSEVAGKPRAAGLEVVLQGGRAIRVERGSDLDLLRAVVDALEAR